MSEFIVVSNSGTTAIVGSSETSNFIIDSIYGGSTLPVPSVNDASASVKGVVKLTGALGGTAASPTTPTAVHITGNEAVGGEKTGVWLNTGPTIDVKLTGTDTTDTPAIQGALNSIAAGRPTVVRLVCGPNYSGQGRINSTLVIPSGVRIVADATAVAIGGGARLQWTGASGGTMVQVTGPRAGIERVALDANNLAATCIEYQFGERQGYEDLTCENFTGIGVKIGNNIANNNGFHGRGTLYIRGLEGSTGLEINAEATEDVHLECVNITPTAATTIAGLPMARSIHFLRGYTTIDELVLDDNNMLGYAMLVEGTAINIGNLISEMAQTLYMTAVGRGKGSRIGTADLRSSAPQSGQYAMDLNGSGEEGLSLVISGLVLNRKAGATVRPDIRVNGMTLVLIGDAWISSDSGAVGIPFATSTGHIVRLGKNQIYYDGLTIANSKSLNTYLSDGVTSVGIARIASSNNQVIGAESDSIGDAFWDGGTGKHEFRGRESSAEAIRARLVQDSGLANGTTNLYVRRQNASGVVSLRQVKASTSPPVGSLLLYVDPT